MRLIATFKDLERARRIDSFLTSQNIQHTLETELNNDWGSDEYGTVKCELWIIDEDDVPKVYEILEREDTLPPYVEKKKEEIVVPVPPTPNYPPPIQKPLGHLTFYLLVACTLIYFMSEWSAPTIQPPLPNLPQVPLLSSPTKKMLYYDYPQNYEEVDTLVDKYGIAALRTPSSLPTEGQQMFRSVYETPMWTGLYPITVSYLRGKFTEEEFKAPLFEKLRQGEIWRPISPIFLHGDIFHLLFNMLWLLVLGRQLEMSLGSWRLVAFIVISALFSNTAQYLMTGANFIGISGVLCAMLAFIWQRQRRAPWEGYQLQASTIRFIFLFIGGLALLQVFSFMGEVFFDMSVSPGIANTAHLSGAFIGYLLSRWPLFHLE